MEKKSIFGTIMFLIVLVMMPFVASSCNNADETLPVKTTMQIDFIKNLYDLDRNQELDMHSIETRGNLTLSDTTFEDILAVAEKIDNNIQYFCKDNADILSINTKTMDLSEDQMDLMRLDMNYFQNFAKKNFSEEVYGRVNEFLNGKLNITIDEIVSNSKLTPAEMTFLANLKTYSELQKYINNCKVNDYETLGNVKFQETRSLSNRKAQLSACLDDYVDDLQLCALDFVEGALSFLPAGPGTAVAAGGVKYAYCAYSSYKDYKRCCR